MTKQLKMWQLLNFLLHAMKSNSASLWKVPRMMEVPVRKKYGAFFAVCSKFLSIVLARKYYCYVYNWALDFWIFALLYLVGNSSRDSYFTARWRCIPHLSTTLDNNSSARKYLIPSSSPVWFHFQWSLKRREGQESWQNIAQWIGKEGKGTTVG